MEQHNKIFIKNIFYMLSYVYKLPKYRVNESISTEPFENIYDLLAGILVNFVNHQLKRGLFRTYIDKQASLSGLRGRISMPGTMSNIMKRKQLIECEFDELSADNIFNQIIKSTIKGLMYHNGVQASRRDALKRAYRYFNHIDTINLNTINWSTLVFQHHNRSYRALIAICKLILDVHLMSTDNGDQRLKFVLEDESLYKLYEDFIFSYYQQEHRNIQVRRPTVSWDIADTYKAKNSHTLRFLPMMKTDVVLRSKKKALIIDAKFYSSTTNKYYGQDTIDSSHLYQIFAYVENMAATNTELEEVSGLLLYANTEDNVLEDVKFPIHGHQIAAGVLDLNTDFQNIKARLDHISYSFLGK